MIGAISVEPGSANLKPDRTRSNGSLAAWVRWPLSQARGHASNTSASRRCWQAGAVIRPYLNGYGNRSQRHRQVLRDGIVVLAAIISRTVTDSLKLVRAGRQHGFIPIESDPCPAVRPWLSWNSGVNQPKVLLKLKPSQRCFRQQRPESKLSLSKPTGRTCPSMTPPPPGTR